MLIFAAITIGILLFLLIWLRKAGGGNFPWIQFYTKGKESGFTMKECNLLRKVAVENRLENPTSLFWSIKTLDRSIRGTVIKLRQDGTANDEESVLFLNKLYDFRARVELNLPKYKLGIKSSRKIVTHQRLKVTVPGVGTYGCQVVENLRRYLAISYPEGPTLPAGFSWSGQILSVYFWRGDDAGYMFESKVLEDFSDQKYSILHIAHSDNLIRSQKRSSVRAVVNRGGSLFLLKNINEATESLERRPGLRCRILDVSTGGAAILIGGRARVGTAVKIQMRLPESTIVMCGVLKGVSYNQKKNQSVLHLQAVPLSPTMLNTVHAYVYNIFGEREPLKKKSKKVSSY